MSDEPSTELSPISPEQAEIERRDDERFETHIFARAIAIVLFIAVVVAARALLV